MQKYTKLLSNVRQETKNYCFRRELVNIKSFSRLKTPLLTQSPLQPFFGLSRSALSQIMFKQKEERDRLYFLLNFFFAISFTALMFCLHFSGRN